VLIFTSIVLIATIAYIVALAWRMHALGYWLVVRRSQWFWLAIVGMISALLVASGMTAAGMHGICVSVGSAIGFIASQVVGSLFFSRRQPDSLKKPRSIDQW